MPIQVSNNAKKAVGYISIFSSPILFAGCIALMFADLMGTFGFVAEKITDASSSGILWKAGVTIVFWVLTSGSQIAVASMCFRAGTSPFLAFPGFIAWLYASIVGKGLVTSKDKTVLSRFIESYEMLQSEWAGLAPFVVIWGISQLFDSTTDAQYFATTPAAWFAGIAFMVSIVAEQGIFLASVARVLGKEAAALDD